MVPKKSSKADLENKKSIFFEIGLATALLLALMAFEWKTSKNIDVKPLLDNNGSITIDLIPITTPDKVIKPAPPKSIVVFDEIRIIANNLTPKYNDSIFNEPSPSDNVFTITPLVENEVDEPFISVAVMPKFGKGGLEEFRNDFVLKNLRYPQDAQNNGVEGWVFIEFVVERDGSISSIKPIRNADSSLINEAIRVLKMSPKWTPGINNGKPARVKFTLPINFVLQH